MPKVLTCVHCRKPIHIRSSDVGQQLACPWCSQPFSVRSAAARDVLPAVPPADPQVITSEAPASRRPAARTSRRMMVNRAMLVVTGIWLCSISCFLAWHVIGVFSAMQKYIEAGLPRAAVLQMAISGAFFWAILCTLPYVAAMLVLWVVRENFRE